MAIIKRILCLANSRKLQGRCIAGREIVGDQPGAWIRPVSNRPNEEVSEYERKYQDGTDPRVLDIIDVPLLGPRPRGHQCENWLLESAAYWTRVGRASWSDLCVFEERANPLWINGYKTFNGANDYIPLDQAMTLQGSLRLIRAESMTLRVFKPHEAFGDSRRRVQAQFKFGKDSYVLWVTDPRIEHSYLAREDGRYPLPGAYLTISLGEPYEGRVYKLVATILVQSEHDDG